MQSFAVKAARRFACAVAAVCAIACAGVLLVAAPAFAKSYECKEVAIDAHVAENGTLHASETRSFEFDGYFTLIGVVLDAPDKGELKVKGVSVRDSAGTVHELEKTGFEKEWRASGGPGKGFYAIDEPRDTVYCFYSYDDAAYSVTVDYGYTNAVLVHKDVAELYWQFVGSKWDVDPGDVTMNLTLPVAAGEQVAGGENVRAWGHGALDGSVRFADDGAVVYNAPGTKAGSFVEARVTFPATWVAKASEDVKDSTEALPSILSEEQAWADDANRERITARIISFVPSGLSFIALIWAIVMFFRHGREHKPEFSDDYWRDVPEKDVEPAVIGRIWRWGDESTEDFTATLMRLSARGCIRMEQAADTKRGLLGGEKSVDTYALVQTGIGTEDMSDLERRAYSLVFTKIGHGAERVTFEQIRAYAKKNPESFVNSFNNWQTKLADQVEKVGVFEEKGESWSAVFKVIPAIFIGVGIVIWYFTDNTIPLVSVLPCSIIMFFVSGKIRRRSERAAEINAKSKALKRWFKDFTNLQEAVPTDTRVWGELLVYAYLFGVADDVIKDLRVKVPQLWNNDWFYYYSYWYWVPDHSSPFAHSLNDAFSASMSTAKAALSSDSSGSGGGGGFSGGGGGGFGGGGGGFGR